MTQWFDWCRRFARRREKIEITVETSESWEIHWFRQSKAERCPVCGAETIFVPPEIAAEIVRCDAGALADLLASGRIHFGETAEKERLICLSSLKKAAVENRPQKFLIDE